MHVSEWAHVCMQCVSVGQPNPLRQVMWVSNTLEGYRIPSSAMHSLSALSKTLTGPRARACQARRQSDGEPPPWCTGPWLSPTHCHWGCTLRGLPPMQHNPDVLHCACGCVQVFMRWVYALRSSYWGYGSVPTKGQCRLRYFLPVSCLSVSGAWDISIIAGKFIQIPQPCQPMTCSPRGHWALTLKDLNEKATSSLKKYHWHCTR